MNVELTAEAFRARFAELLSAGGKNTPESPGCLHCRECTFIQGCTFCTSSQRLLRCHYCDRCASCVDCSHCSSSELMLQCHYAVGCSNCVDCSHVRFCHSLCQCEYCFGCVGISGKQFWILNQRFEPADYHAAVRRLARQLDSVGP